MAAGPDLPRVLVESRTDLRAWLEANHAQSGSVWLVTWKKDSGKPHLPYSEIVDEALCFGWIDSLPRRLDEHRSMLRLSQRKPTSAWSAINKAKANRLAADGLMKPSGLAAIAAAKANGSWTRLDGVETLELPPDLAHALKASKAATRHFEAFPKSVRRAILEWIALAKRPETRAKRVAETVDKARENIRANQWRQS